MAPSQGVPHSIFKNVRMVINHSEQRPSDAQGHFGGTSRRSSSPHAKSHTKVWIGDLVGGGPEGKLRIFRLTDIATRFASGWIVPG